MQDHCCWDITAMSRTLMVLILAVSLLHCTQGDHSGSGFRPTGITEITEGTESTGCNEYDFRLVRDNSSNMQGLVERCYSTDANVNKWGPICVDGITTWSQVHATAVCQELELPYTDALPITYHHVPGPYSYTIVCEFFNCVSNPTPFCTTMTAGGVICHDPEERRECETGDVRLVNGSELAGRLEVCFKGLWGTVCGDQHWNHLHASIICKQLGFTNDSAIPIGVVSELYGAGPSTQPVLIQEVVCSGSEANISECNYTEVQFCPHSNDAAVACEAPPDSCSDGDIRLVGSSSVDKSSANGTIEVCYTGVWGAVCAKYGYWDGTDANVACRQLRYDRQMFTERRPEDSMAYLLSGIECSGSEERLADCSHDGVNLGDTEGCELAFVSCIRDTKSGSGGLDQDSIIATSILGAFFILVLVSIIIVTTYIVVKKCSLSSVAISDLRDESMPEITEISTELGEVEAQLTLEITNKNVLVSKAEIQLSGTIGQGEFGLVYKGYVKKGQHGNMLVAIKTSKAMFSERERENLLKEISTMAAFEHPNVMELVGVCLDADMPLIIMPFMMNGTVLEHVRKMKEENLQEEMIRSDFLRICQQISKGMVYLTSQKVVHRDLAARNCMIDENNVIKVADFGLCEDVYNTGYFCQNREDAEAREEKLPIRWMAPESIESGRFNEKTDVWAFGVTCWEIFTCGRVPYSGITAMSILRLLKSGERLERPSNSIATDEICDVMAECWSEARGDRPNFTSLVDTLSNILERESDYLLLTPDYQTV